MPRLMNESSQFVFSFFRCLFFGLIHLLVLINKSPHKITKHTYCIFPSGKLAKILLRIILTCTLPLFDEKTTDPKFDYSHSQEPFSSVIMFCHFEAPGEMSDV